MAGEERLVSREMIAVFVLFGAELIPVVVILGAVDIISTVAAALVVGAIVAFFAGWIGLRWQRLHADTDDSTDPVETLKQRYAAGELSEAEFERKLDRLMDADEEATEDSTRERITERSSN